MYLAAVKYKDSYLAPGSKCLELYQIKKFKELDALLKRLDAEEYSRLAQK